MLKVNLWVELATFYNNLTRILTNLHGITLLTLQQSGGYLCRKSEAVKKKSRRNQKAARSAGSLPVPVLSAAAAEPKEFQITDGTLMDVKFIGHTHWSEDVDWGGTSGVLCDHS